MVGSRVKQVEDKDGKLLLRATKLVDATLDVILQRSLQLSAELIPQPTVKRKYKWGGNYSDRQRKGGSKSVRPEDGKFTEY